MLTVELCSGTGSFSKAAKAKGHRTFTVDIDPKHKPDLVKDVTKVRPEDLPYRPDVVWFSPPCQKFSVMVISKNWKKVRGEYVPISEGAKEAVRLVKSVLALIEELKPRYFFIENPMGMLRVMPFMRKYLRRTVTYCQYGDFRQKKTDIWTNCLEWEPKPPCRAKDPCHERAPRGSHKGTQRMKNAVVRSEIPQPLMAEVVEACERGFAGISATCQTRLAIT